MKSMFKSAGLTIAVTLIGGLAVPGVISMADEQTAVPEKKTESRQDARSADEKPSEEDVLSSLVSIIGACGTSGTAEGIAAEGIQSSHERAVISGDSSQSNSGSHAGSI